MIVGKEVTTGSRSQDFFSSPSASSMDHNLSRVLKDLKCPHDLPFGKTLEDRVKTSEGWQNLVEWLMLCIEPRIEDMITCMDETPTNKIRKCENKILTRAAKLASMAKVIGMISPATKDCRQLVSGTANYDDVIAFVSRLTSMASLTNKDNLTTNNAETGIENLRIGELQGRASPNSRFDHNLRSRTGASSALLDTICQPTLSTQSPTSNFLSSVLSEDCKLFPPEIDDLLQTELQRLTGTTGNMSEPDSISRNTMPRLSDFQSLFNEEENRLVDEQRNLEGCASEFDFQETPGAPSSSHPLLQNTVHEITRDIANFEKFYLKEGRNAVQRFRLSPAGNVRVISGLGEASRSLLEKSLTLTNHLGALDASLKLDRDLHASIAPLLDSSNKNVTFGALPSLSNTTRNLAEMTARLNDDASFLQRRAKELGSTKRIA